MPANISFARKVKPVRVLGKCRNEYPVIGEGRYRELLLTNRQYAFARIGQEEAVIVAVNNDEQEACIQIPLPMQTDTLINLETGEPTETENGKILLKIEAGGSCLIAAGQHG